MTATGRAVAGGREAPTRKGAATRERLLQAASRLFAEQGYDATSVDAIATAAGITVPGMYKHFSTKATVLLEVARRVNRASAARRTLGAGSDLAGELAALFAEYLAEGEIERRRLSIELSRAAFANEALRRSLARYNEVLRGALQETMLGARPALARPRGEPELLAHLLLVLLMGAIHIDTLDARLIGDPTLIAHLRATLSRLLDEASPPAVATADGGDAGRRGGVRSARVAMALDPEPTDGRRRKAARTRRRILEAAAELFALRGYDATTIDLIAAKAEITVPGLYLHVASKEELLIEVGRRTFASYRLAGPLGSGDEVAAHLADLAAAFSSRGDRVSRRLAIELDFGAWRSPALASGLSEYHRLVRGNVASALATVPVAGASDAAGVERAHELAAMVVLMLFMGIAHLDTVDPSLVGDRVWADFLHRRMPQLVR